MCRSYKPGCCCECVLVLYWCRVECAGATSQDAVVSVCFCCIGVGLNVPELQARMLLWVCACVVLMQGWMCRRYKPGCCCECVFLLYWCRVECAGATSQDAVEHMLVLYWCRVECAGATSQDAVFNTELVMWSTQPSHDSLPSYWSRCYLVCTL